MVWERLKRLLLVLFFPVTGGCMLCRGEEADPGPCPECRGRLELITPPYCHRCGRQLECGGERLLFCRECQYLDLAFDRALAAAAYRGYMRELIYAFKYGSEDWLARPLGLLMAEVVRDRGLDLRDGVVIPVPLHARRRRERGFNQAKLLARVVAGELGLPLLEDGLRRTRPTRPLSGLDRSERFRDLRGSLRVEVPERVGGREVLVVDDILTSGATLHESARVLRQSGARRIWGLVLARGDYAL